MGCYNKPVALHLDLMGGVVHCGVFAEIRMIALDHLVEAGLAVDGVVLHGEDLIRRWTCPAIYGLRPREITLATVKYILLLLEGVIGYCSVSTASSATTHSRSCALLLATW